MEEDSIVCSWVFDVAEYKKTQVLARRIYTNWSKLAGFAFIVILGFAGIFTSPSKIDIYDPGIWIPIVVMILLAIYVVSQQLPISAFVGTWSFRRGDVYKTLVNQTISQEGYSSEEGDVRAMITWSGLQKALETTEGFALFRPAKKKTFLWLPKHGFASQGDVDRCRELIRKNLQDFRTLKS